MANSESKRRYIISVFCFLFLILILVSSSTYAYWSWVTSSEEETVITFDIEGQDMNATLSGAVQKVSNLVPTVCTDEVYAIKKEITLTYDNNTDVDAVIEGTLSVQDFVNPIGELTQDDLSHFRYALTTSDSSCTTEPVNGASGAFTTTDGMLFSNVVLKRNVPAGTTNGSQTYYLWVWLDEDYVHINYDDVIDDPTQNLSFTLVWTGTISNGYSYQEDTVPVLESGMVPVTIANDGTVTTISAGDKNWYNYNDKEWANAVLVKESGTQTRSYYLNNLSNNVKVNQSDILAYYVWIPRYKYEIWNVSTSSTPQTINIEFEDKDVEASLGTTVGSWRTHPAFIWGDSVLPGIWVGKFETTGDSTNPTILPNTSSLRNQNVSTQFATALKFSGGILSNGLVSFSGSSTYGLTKNTDSHMMKNSEWGAVAYLSHSQYGMNSEIRINNNNTYTTGCGAGEENSSETAKCQIAYGGATSYPQSTTGNITGIFDMSGGSIEYVMGVFAASTGQLFSGNSTAGNSGFNGIIVGLGSYTSGIDFPATKYYDVFQANSGTNVYEINACNSGICYGHALSEVKGWYSDAQTFLSSTYPWLARGDLFSLAAQTGAFAYYQASGVEGEVASFRSTLISDIDSDNSDNSDNNVVYTINYNANGGTGSMDEISCTSGSSCTLTANGFTREGYTFAGWNTADDGSGTTYANKYIFTSYNLNNNLTLYAQWTAHTYTIKYHLGNGTSTAGSTAFSTTTSCTYGTACTLATFADLGGTFPHSSGGNYDYWWTFYGWGTSTSDTSRDYSNGASVSNLTSTDGGTVNLYAIGYRSLGFFTYVDASSPAVANNSYYQYWNPHSTDSAYLTSITIPEAPAISGWTFVGYKGGDGSANSSVDFAASTVGTSVTPAYNVGKAIRSKYKRTLTINYSCNSSTSASNTTATQYYNAGIGAANTAAITTPTFTLRSSGTGATGYTVTKWNTASDGSGTSYNLGASYNAWTPAVNDTTVTKTLYCVTTPNKVTIKYDTNGGSITPSTTTAEGTTYTWSTDDDGIIYRNGSLYKPTVSYGSTVDLANWDNSVYVQINHTVLSAVEGAEWICLSGCKTSGATFADNVAVNATDFCDLSSSSCTVVLGVNWQTTINAVRTVCEGSNYIARYYVTECNTDGLCKISKKNGVNNTDGFGPSAASWTLDIRGEPLWADDDAYQLDTRTTHPWSMTQSLYQITNHYKGPTKRGTDETELDAQYTCDRKKVTVTAESGLNCREWATTGGTLVKGYVQNASLNGWRTTTKFYGVSYYYYYSMNNGCYMSAQYLSVASHGVSSLTTETAGQCRCGTTSYSCADNSATGYDTLTNMTACSTFCSEKSSTMTYSSCATQKISS